MQLVVVKAVRKAVSAATNTFTSNSIVDLFFIASKDPPGPCTHTHLWGGISVFGLHAHPCRRGYCGVSSGGQAG